MRLAALRWRQWRVQLLALGTFVKQSRSIRDALQTDDSYWAQAVPAYAALMVSRLLAYSSAQCCWHVTGEKMQPTFLRFAFPIVWDVAEVNSLSELSGGFTSAFEWIFLVLGHFLQAEMTAPVANTRCGSATSPPAENGTKYDVVLTDPPYYDAIPYSDLMDFHYVWLRRLLFGLAVDINEGVRQPLAPKWDAAAVDGELIDDESRHGGDRARSKAAYEDGMTRAFNSARSMLHADGRMVVVFANKQPDAWETLVESIIRAGFVVDASWPIQTEMGTRMRAHASAALASSVWLVCKKRPVSARPGWDNKVLEEMRENIAVRLREFWDSGIRGPDFVWAATGPALEAYSKHPVVKKANEPGPMTVAEFLTHVRRIVVDFVVGRVLAGDGDEDGDVSADRLDDPTSYYLLHRHDFGFGEAPAGTCILYAVSCGLSDRELVDNWNLLSKGGGSTATANGNDADPDREAEVDEGSGSKLKLKTWAQRKNRTMGYEAPGGRPVPLIDRVHRLMHLWQGGDVHKVDEYLDDQGLRRHELFNRLLQSLIELSEPGSDERSILERLSNHIGAKGAKRKDPQKALAFGDDE